MLTGGRDVKSMLTLARGIEVRYRKTQIFVTKCAFQGVTLLFSIKYNSGVIVGGKTMKKSSCNSNRIIYGFTCDNF